MEIYINKRGRCVRESQKTTKKSIAYAWFIAAVLIVMSYLLGGLTGYAIGYNDNYADKVVKYRKTRGMRG